MKNTSPLIRCARAAVLSLGLLAAVGQTVLAGQTDIASAPLFTSTTTKVKPNVMFVLDDSGSMAWDFMPDNASFNVSDYNSVYGRRSSQCNGLAYNPKAAEAAYKLPVDALGVEVPNASMGFLSGDVLSAGSVNYLGSGSPAYTKNQNRSTSPTSLTTVSGGSVSLTLSNSNVSYFPGMVVTVFGTTLDSLGGVIIDASRYMIGKVATWDSGTKLITVNVAMAVGSGTMNAVYLGSGSAIDNVYYTYNGSQKPALDFRYPNNSLDTTSKFYQECSSTIPSTAGQALFTATIVTPGSAEAQRYANWYYFYSTRMRMMKTSLTLAFKDIDDRYRVGFSTINESSELPTLDVADFGSTQKSSFYSQIVATRPGGNTPLRAALSKAGRYYAKDLRAQTSDPVQYSCQKNFTILSTDGYWNSTAGVALGGQNTVGQQDAGATARPMFDGGVTTSTTMENWSVTSTVKRTTVTPYQQVDKLVTSVYTPTNGQSFKTYSLGTLSRAFSNSAVSIACSSRGRYPCTVNVTTSSNHGFSSGQTVDITGVSKFAYNGSFPITVTGTRSYSYTLSGSGTGPTAPASFGTTTYAPDSCPVGQGLQQEQLMTRDQYRVNTNSRTTTSTWTNTLVESVSTTTSYVRTVVMVNGVQQSDNTTNTPGSPTVRTVSSTNSTKNVDTVSVPSISSATSGWVASGSPVNLGCAASAKPATSPITIGVTTSAYTTNTPTPGTAVAGTAGVTTETPVETATSKTTSTSSNISGGSNDSLADVAMYYYQTDLRDATLNNCTGALGKSVCTNDVSPIGNDKAAWQHMTTFTLSLGMNGTLQYDPNYEGQSRGDFADIVSGSRNWPVPSSNGGAVNIDDLWHAAVNGRGRYFSASNPATLSSSLASALNSISAVLGSSSAAATSTLQPVEGDNGVYIAQFMSAEWTGDLRAYKIDPDTGAVKTTAIDSSGNKIDLADWSASAQLSPATARTIYYFKPGSGMQGSLREFTYANLTDDGLNGRVDNSCSKTPSLTQCSGLTGTSLAAINSGANMVSFLRGQAQSQYRARSKVLGDIVNSSPVYVAKPTFQYSENGYDSFKSLHAGRAPTLYVGANDGMLHAFNALTGAERWAYIPGLVLPRLYQLGDQFYESKHQFFVDATPVVGDVYTSSGWRTILVGGLNAGGSGYYALDVTDPAAPVALWEFTDSKLGLSFGNPIITKRKNGTWVVAFTSGYNNSDGEGHLFIVDAMTGTKLDRIDTGEGSAGDPSGLGRINAWVDYETENLATRFYAGDLKGNVWRFDVDGLYEPKKKALKLAQLVVNGVPQPITSQPQLAEIQSNGSSYPVVYVGTGRYLGKSDVSDVTQQSIYAIKDSLTNTELGDVRAGGTLVAQTIETKGSVRTVSSSNPVDWSTNNGWYVDLMTVGERVNVDMQLAFNVLTAAGNVPGASATDCADGKSGTSWLYQLSILTGGGSGGLLNSMVAGLSTVQLSKGTGVTIVTKTDVSEPEPKTSPPLLSAFAPARRTAWRELMD